MVGFFILKMIKYIDVWLTLVSWLSEIWHTQNWIWWGVEDAHGGPLTEMVGQLRYL
jgi:hypothetical protein